MSLDIRTCEMFIVMDETDFCAIDIRIPVMFEMNELTVRAQEDVWTLMAEDGESPACVFCGFWNHAKRER